MSRRRDARYVDVWRQYHCDTRYSISIADEEGDEITCVGGDDSLEQAWSEACEIADDRRLTVRLIHESGETMREYSPKSSVSQ